MPAQIRPNRLEVTDRFPMLAFTLSSSEGPRLAEVVLASDLKLFADPAARNSTNFYSSREHGALSIAATGSVYTVPPLVLARFIAANRLYFGLATASAPGGQDWRIDVMPGEASPYVSLSGLTDRALRRVRMFPVAPRGGGVPSTGGSGWIGDTLAAPAPVAAAPAAPVEAATPAPVPYNDGFGPLEPLAPQPESAQPAPAPVQAPTAQGLTRATGRGFEVDPDTVGIDGPVLDDQPVPAVTAGLGTSPLTTAEYSGVTRIMASPNFTSGRRNTAIDRIVIHITSSPQRPSLGSWFMNPAAKASSHYMVDQNGDIIQFVREQDTAWHARSANRRSIGIEHVAVEQGGARYGSTVFPYDPPTDAEYRASAALVAHLCRKYGLEPNRTTIVGHNEIDTGTTHTACPVGAWDWDAYMALVADCYARLPATGVGGSVAQGLSQGEVDPEAQGIEAAPYSDEPAPAVAAGLSLAAAEYDRVSRIAPSPAFTAGRSGTAIDRIVIHITDAPTTSSTVNTFSSPTAQASAHYLVGQDGEIVQFVSEADTAWHAKGANRRSIGIEHVAIKSGGADYRRRDGTMQHYDALPPTQLQYEESALLVSHLCEKYGLPKNRTTIIGHNEADTKTSHTACPVGNWDWDYFMRIVETGQCQSDPPAAQGLGLARAMDVETQTVEIKYRAFIPAPAITGPFFDNYHGDGRGFSYSSGTSRGEITFTVDVDPSGAVSNLRTVDRHWMPSHSYSSSDTFAVPGKPSWWLGLNSGAVPTGTDSCATNDDTLRAYVGAPGTTRNVLATVERASIVSVWMSGNNPLVPGSPAIDADVSILLRRTGDGGIEAKANGSHDGFPSHELYVNQEPLFRYDPVAAGNDPSALFPPEDISEDTQWVRVASGHSTGQSLAKAMADGDVTVSDQRVAVTAPTTEEFSQLRSIAIQALIAANPTLLPMVVALRAAAELSGYSIGIGPHAGAGLLGGAGFGYGLIFAPGNRMGAYGGVDVNAGLIAGIGAQVQVTIVNGGIDAFGGISYAAGISGGEFYQGGAAALFDANRNFNGVQIQVGVGVGLSPVEIYTGVQRAVSTQLGIAMGADDWSINWDDVESIAQPTDMGCWATSAAMVTGWRDQVCIDPNEIARITGFEPEMTSGLSANQVKAFFSAIGLQPGPAACFTPDGFRQLIETRGPAFVVARVPGLHAIVVTGMYKRDGKYYVRITDPWDREVGTPGSPGAAPNTHNTGSRYIMTYDAFAAEYEASAGWGDHQLAFGGVNAGRLPNTGIGAPAGYAQGLARQLGDEAAAPAVVPPAQPTPAPAEASQTRSTSAADGRTYDLAQLTGMVRPSNALAGGAGMPAIPGQRVVLNEWPYIDDPAGRTIAPVAIDWKFDGAAVGDVAIAPDGGAVFNGRTVGVRADIETCPGNPNRAELLVRVTTTFGKAGEPDEVAVSEVLLGGDGMTSTRYAGTQPVKAPASPAPASAAPAPQPAMA